MNNYNMINWIFIILIQLILIEYSLATETPFDDELWEKISKGEIIVRAIKSDDGIYGVKAIFTIASSRYKIWNTLIDYKNFHLFFDGIKKIKVLDKDDKGANVEFWIDAIITDVHYVLYRHYEQKGRKINWKRVSGDLKRIEGSWLIMDSPNSKLKILIYESYVKAGGIVPSKIIQWGAIKETQSMGIRLRDWIENKAKY